MTPCTNCTWFRIVGISAAVIAAGTALFFSCGKTDDAQKKSATTTKNGDDVEIRLTFDAYADKDIDSFRLYAGKTKDTLKYVSDVEPGADFKYDAPELDISSTTQKGLDDLLGANACFKLTAMRGTVESEDSNIVCADL